MAKKIWVGTDTGNEGKWATAANWSPAAVPENADDVYLENGSQDITGDLDQSAVALASLNIDQSYTGKVAALATYLQIGAAKVELGYHHGPDSPPGSGRIKLDLGSATAAAVVVHNTGASADSNKPAVRLKAANAATTVEVRKGQVGVAFDTGETSTVGAITVSYVGNKVGDADVFIGEGVTLTTFKQTGGENILCCAATTVTGVGGVLTTIGTGAIATLNGQGATIYSNSTGTITDMVVDGPTVDFTRSSAPRTVTNPKLNPGGVLKRDPAVVTFTNGVDSDEAVTLQAI